MADVIQIRRDTAANWTSADPTLAQGEFGWEIDTGRIKVGDGSTAWISLAYSFEAISDHGGLTGLADDDHLQYLTEARHDALPSDNPHSVTFTQAVTADGGTDISAAEAETLTDGSNADALHLHSSGGISDFNEAAQDAVGGILTDSASIDFEYTDGLDQITAYVIPGGVDHDQLANVGTNTHAQIDTHIANTSNPHSVTFTQAVAADGGTDISAAEAETLTDGSNADALHDHDHDALTNFVSNEHVDHTAVDIETAANSGLSGGGDISSTRSLEVDPNNATAGTVASGDEILFGDIDDSNNLKKTTAQDIADLAAGTTDHGALTGLGDDDHTQYLNETRHDALPSDNPHSVTFTQASTADGGTDITAAEAETLTDGSDASSLHDHDSIYYTESEVDALIAAVDLQAAYDNGADAIIDLTSGIGGVGIRDNATPIGGNLLEVSNNAGTTEYFAVDASECRIGNNNSLKFDDSSNHWTIHNDGTRLHVHPETSDLSNNEFHLHAPVVISDTFNQGSTESGTGFLSINGTLNLNAVGFTTQLYHGLYFTPTINVSNALFASGVIYSEATINLNTAQFGTVFLFTAANTINARGGMSNIITYQDASTVVADTSNISSKSYNCYQAAPTLKSNASRTSSWTFDGLIVSPTLNSQSGATTTISTYTAINCGIIYNSGPGTNVVTTARHINLTNMTLPTNLYGINSNINTNSGANLFIRHTGTANSNMGPDNCQYRFGTGQDASIYYDGTNFILDPDLVGSGRVLIGATGDDDLNSRTIRLTGDDAGAAATNTLTGTTDTPTTDPGWTTSSTVDMNAPDGYIKAYVGTQAVVIPYWNT